MRECHPLLSRMRKFQDAAEVSNLGDGKEVAVGGKRQVRLEKCRWHSQTRRYFYSHGVCYAGQIRADEVGMKCRRDVRT